MTHSVAGSIAEILRDGDARVHERWVDGFDNVWEVRDILINTSIDILDDGVDNKTGYGRIDAYEAVKAAQ